MAHPNDPRHGDAHAGFSEAELTQAFDRVSPVGDWKAAIDAVVEIDSASELAAICAAIEFYTATIPQVTRVGGLASKRFAIKATGYRMGPAGDH